jgi:hypothetical protein
MGEFFEDVDDLGKDGNRYPFITEGSYEELEVIGLSGFKNKEKQNMVAAEFKVLKASGANARPVGTSTVHLINLAKPGAGSNLTSLVSGLTGLTGKQITKELVTKIVPTPENKFLSPAIGHKVAAEAVPVPRRNGDGNWTKVNYRTTGDTVSFTAAPEAGTASGTRPPAKGK